MSDIYNIFNGKIIDLISFWLANCFKIVSQLLWSVFDTILSLMVSTILPYYPNYEIDLIRGEGGEEKEEDEEEKSLLCFR